MTINLREPNLFEGNYFHIYKILLGCFMCVLCVYIISMYVIVGIISLILTFMKI